MSPNLKGILAISASAGGFLLNDATMKYVTSVVPPGQALFLRGLGATTLIYLVMIALRQPRPFALLAHPAVLLRSVAAAGSAIFILLSLQVLPLATVNAVMQVSPLAVMAGAGLLLGERIEWRRWAAALAGFAGVLAIIRPGADFVQSGALLTLIALAFTATRDLATRWTPPQASALFIALAGSMLVALGGLSLRPLEAWISPPSNALALIGLASVFITIAYVFGVIAMRNGELSIVAPFRYVQMPLSVGLGYLIWSHVPDRIAAAGMGLVVAAGLYVLSREQAARRRARQSSASAPA